MSNIFNNFAVSDDEDETVTSGKARLTDKKHDGTGTSGKSLSSHKKKGANKDRLSGTGRGKEQKKGGAGGHNWGNYKYDGAEDRKGDDPKSEESEDEGPSAEDQLTVEEFLKKNPTLQSEAKNTDANKLKEQFKGMQVVKKTDIDDDQDHMAPGKLSSTDGYKFAMQNDNVELLGFRVSANSGNDSSRGGRGGRGGFRGKKRGGFNGDRAERSERAERGERSDRGRGAPRGGRGGRGDRGAKGAKPEAAKDNKEAPKKEEKPKGGNFKSAKKGLDVDDATQFPSL